MSAPILAPISTCRSADKLTSRSCHLTHHQTTPSPSAGRVRPQKSPWLLVTTGNVSASPPARSSPRIYVRETFDGAAPKRGPRVASEIEITNLLIPVPLLSRRVPDISPSSPREWAPRDPSDGSRVAWLFLITRQPEAAADAPPAPQRRETESLAVKRRTSGLKDVDYDLLFPLTRNQPEIVLLLQITPHCLPTPGMKLPGKCEQKVVQPVWKQATWGRRAFCGRKNVVCLGLRTTRTAVPDETGPRVGGQVLRGGGNRRETRDPTEEISGDGSVDSGFLPRRGAGRGLRFVCPRWAPSFPGLRRLAAAEGGGESRFGARRSRARCRSVPSWQCDLASVT